MADQKEILESIRDIIAGITPSTDHASVAPEDDDILDLTQVLNADGSVTDISAKSKAATPEPELEEFKKPEAEKADEAQTPTTENEKDITVPSNDILSEIDSILNDQSTPVEPQTATAEVDEDDVELEFLLKDQQMVEPTTDEEIREEAKELATKPEGFEPPIVPVEETNTKGKDMENSDSIISSESADAAKASISGLVDKLKTQGREANKVEPLAPFRSGATVEDLVVEMLKPMMKDWLDANLPKLVNEIVTKEIQKLIPRD